MIFERKTENRENSNYFKGSGVIVKDSLREFTFAENKKGINFVFKLDDENSINCSFFKEVSFENIRRLHNFSRHFSLTGYLKSRRSANGYLNFNLVVLNLFE